MSYCKLESDAVKAERFRKYLAKVSASVGNPNGAERYRPIEHKTAARLATQKLATERSKARTAYLKVKRA